MARLGSRDHIEPHPAHLEGERIGVVLGVVWSHTPGTGVRPQSGEHHRWFSCLCPTLLSFRRLVQPGSRGSDGSHEGPAGQPVLPEGGGGLGPDAGVTPRENHGRPVSSKRARGGGKDLLTYLGVFLAGEGDVFFTML